MVIMSGVYQALGCALLFVHATEAFGADSDDLTVWEHTVVDAAGWGFDWSDTPPQRKRIVHWISTGRD